MAVNGGRGVTPRPPSTVLTSPRLKRSTGHVGALEFAGAPDAALIAAWQRGDEGAAAELVRRHSRPLARFLASAGAEELHLEDLVQDTFVRAFRALHRFRGQCQFRTWLLTIGANLLRDSRRRAKRRRMVSLDEHQQLRATGGDPHDHAVASETETRLGQAIAALPRMQREVFLLRAQQGLEYDEIAAALETSIGAARVHYHHAVKRLKESLA